MLYIIIIVVVVGAIVITALIIAVVCYMKRKNRVANKDDDKEATENGQVVNNTSKQEDAHSENEKINKINESSIIDIIPAQDDHLNPKYLPPIVTEFPDRNGSIINDNGEENYTKRKREKKKKKKKHREKADGGEFGDDRQGIETRDDNVDVTAKLSQPVVENGLIGVTNPVGLANTDSVIYDTLQENGNDGEPRKRHKKKKKKKSNRPDMTNTELFSTTVSGDFIQDPNMAAEVPGGEVEETGEKKRRKHKRKKKRETDEKDLTLDGDNNDLVEL